MVMTTRAEGIWRTVRVLGRSTSMPDCKTGAVIMKITSKTSITSMNGTMLISESELAVGFISWGIANLSFRSFGSPGPQPGYGNHGCRQSAKRLRRASAFVSGFQHRDAASRGPRRHRRALLARHLDVRHHFRDEIVHPGGEFADAVEKVVVKNHRRNRGKQ